MILSSKYLNTDWKSFVESELNKDYMKKIEEHISQSIEPVYPPMEKVFNAFNFFDIKDTKVVIFGQDPYHGEGEANGLAFSVNHGIKTPPSLRNIFKKINADFNLNRTDTDLSDWAKQGFLLLNTALTVQKDQANSHSNIGWINFTKAVTNQLNKNEQPILFVLWGNNAQSLEQYIDSTKHKIIKSCHPSPLSAKRCGFFDAPTFIDINNFLKNTYNFSMKW